MKNAFFLLIFLFSLVFAAPDEKPLSYTERRNKLNKDINDCIIKGEVSDKVKNILNGKSQEDVRFTIRPILKELTETDKNVIKECRKNLLKAFYDSENKK